MLFLMYFDLNENATPEDIMKGAAVLQKANIQLEGTETKTWLVTPEYWGIAIVECSDETTLSHGINMWSQASPGIYKQIRYSIALNVEKYAPKLMELIAKINKAK